MPFSIFGKIFSFSSRMVSSPLIISLIINLSLLTFRFVESMKQNFGFFQIIIVISLIFETFIAVSINKIKKCLKDKSYLTNVLFTIIHVVIIYMDPFKEDYLQFFEGIELMTVFSLNFREIHKRTARLAIIGLSYTAFLKKFTNFENNFEENLYFIYVLFIFETTLELNKEKIIKKIYETKTKLIISEEEINQSSKQDKQILIQTIDKSLDFSNSNNDDVLINRINLGIININQDLQINFCNKSFLEFFETEDREEAKTLFFQLEENASIKQSKFSELSEFTLKNLFMDTLLLPDSFKSYKQDGFSEAENSSISSKENPDPNFMMNFRRWKKKELSLNSGTKINNNFNRKVIHPKSVLSYLENIFKYIQSKSYSSHNISNECNKFFMYVDYRSKIGKDKETSFLINFIPFDVNANSSFNGVLITIRKLSDLEARTKTELNSKNKMLGSFCHELRTPINGLLNMLELLQTQMEELNTKEDFNKKCNELLISSIINSNLLLSKIDDFIEYFAYCNEMIELHVENFDFISFLNETHRIFANIALKKNINLYIEIDDSIPKFITNDKKKLRQIIYNLLRIFKKLNTNLIIFF